MLTNPGDAVRSTILRTLRGRRSLVRHGLGEIDEECNLLELGLIDSEDLIEIILEVEDQCQCEFNPEAIDMANGVTLRTLVSAFVAKG